MQNINAEEATLRLDTHEALRLLLWRSNIELESSGAWKLSDRTAAKLRHALGRPDGGWSKFLALLAGTRYFSASMDGFTREAGPEDVEGFDELDVQKLMIRAFTVDLVPPQLAASLFITAGVHPAWGLKVSHHKQNKESTFDSDLFDSDSLAVLVEMIDNIIEDVLEFVESRESFLIEELRLHVDDVVEQERDEALTLTSDSTGIDILLPSGSLGSYFAEEVVSDLLVPAGVCTMLDHEVTVVDTSPLQLSSK